MTVTEVARRVGRDPETVRRWIRSGKLRARKVGMRHVIEEADLDAIGAEPETLPIPNELRVAISGSPQPDWVRLIRRSRRGR
ncbi:MAG: helix-turn-helix domain-containing protein [Chloroflexota bacterium]|nr:helix-turn-helix domain-containing protein [Chloroflexota bacterium]